MFDNSEEAFYKELLNDFRNEASEHYETIVKGLLDLESKEEDYVRQQVIETIYRSTHSLKGAARAVNLSDIERLCFSLETMFGHLKRGEISLTPQLLDTLHKSADMLDSLIKRLIEGRESNENNNLNQTIKNLEYIIKISLEASKKRWAKAKESFPEELNTKSGEISEIEDREKNSDKISPQSVKPDEELTSTRKIQEERADQSSVRISTEHLNRILSESEDFITIKTTLDFYRKGLEELYMKYRDDSIYNMLKDLISFQTVSSRMIDDLVSNIKYSLLSNFGTLFKLLPKMVRDISKEREKDISILFSGEETEIDRRILDEFKDPLLHIIRNCIDHGIEKPEIRQQLGKKPKGNILVKVEKLIERKVRISITDDGSGIDESKILESAIKNGAITPDAGSSLTKGEILSLILKSGISSRKFVTDISGRGLGMTIVAEKVSRLGGEITIESTEGKGTTFTVTLPQTISTFRGVLVECEGMHLIIPSGFVEKAIQVPISSIQSIGDKNVIKLLDGESVGVVKLSQVLGIPAKESSSSKGDSIKLMILSHNPTKLAFVVNAVYGEHEGIVKDLGPQLKYVRNIAGVTLIENSKLVPVINVTELIQSAVERSASKSSKGVNETSKKGKADGAKRVLVVEDSITIRSMLRSFLEGAGFIATTAIDGIDGLNKLENDKFDVVVSDIEMPRMNGFELTKKIRSNSALSDTPVILVTALESGDDMKKGMEAGADAYIVKSSFEQSNLLETIKRFI